MPATSPYPPSRGVYDEALAPDGEPREAGGAGLALLGPDLPALAGEVQEALEDRARLRRGHGAVPPRREPLLRSVRTLDLCVPGQLEQALDELETLVVKPRLGHGGVGVVVCPHAEREDVERVRAELIARPQDYVAQPTIEISLHPTVIGGELRPRHVDLRPFVFMHGAGKAVVMPGGLTRVAFGEGAMVVNSTQNGGAKDTWVLP